MSTEIIVIIVVGGIAGLVFFVTCLALLCMCCSDYYRLCQRRQLTPRRLLRVLPVAVPTSSQANSQPMEVLDVREFDLTSMTPSYQLATKNRQ